MKELLKFWWRGGKRLTMFVGGIGIVGYIAYMLLIIHVVKRDVETETDFVDELELWAGIMVGLTVLMCNYIHSYCFVLYRHKATILLPASLDDKYCSSIFMVIVADLLIFVCSLLFCFLPLAYYFHHIFPEFVASGQVMDLVSEDYFKARDCFCYIYLLSLASLVGVIARKAEFISVIVLGGLYYLLITFFHQLPSMIVCLVYVGLTVCNYYLTYIIFKRNCCLNPLINL